jgi:hypothetical protein
MPNPAPTKFPIRRFLRVLFAGLFVFACMIAFAYLFSGPLAHIPDWLIPPLVLVTFFVVLLLAFLLFRGKSPVRRTREQILAERQAWDAAGLLTHQSFRALRAFEVDEYEDEGAHYFLELEDHSVLYLTGQFLYEYEPYETSKFKRARLFPCTQFTIRRRKQDNSIVDILCSGEILEPETTTPPYLDKEITNHPWAGEDVYHIQNQSYDHLKSQRLPK